MNLTVEQRQCFNETGFVLVPALLDAAQVSQVSQRVDALIHAPEISGGVWKYSDDEALARGERILSRIEHFVSHDLVLARLVNGPLCDLVAAAMGEPAVLFKDKLNLKLPGSSGFLPHQDAQAGWTRYCDVQVTCMVAVDENTHENGCLEVCVDARRASLMGEPWQPLADEAVAHLPFVPIPMSPGDVVLFDSYLVHRSAPNRTDRARRVLYATYNPRSQGDHYARYFADKHASYPPDVDREPQRAYRYRV